MVKWLSRRISQVQFSFCVGAKCSSGQTSGFRFQTCQTCNEHGDVAFLTKLKLLFHSRTPDKTEEEAIVKRKTGHSEPPARQTSMANETYLNLGVEKTSLFVRMWPSRRFRSVRSIATVLESTKKADIQDRTQGSRLCFSLLSTLLQILNHFRCRLFATSQFSAPR